MGGPWIAKVSIDGNTLNGEYILQPAAINNNQTMVALVKPVKEKSFLITKLRFAITIIDTNGKVQYLSKEKYYYCT